MPGGFSEELDGTGPNSNRSFLTYLYFRARYLNPPQSHNPFHSKRDMEF